MSELRGPAYNQIADYIKSKRLVEFRTLNNEILKGYILWHDNNLFHLNLENGKEITLYKNAIAYYSLV